MAASTGRAGRAMAGMMDVFAEFERATIRARIVAAMRVMKLKRQVWNHAPYGWKVSADGKTFEPHDKEQKACILAMDLRAGGLSLRAIGEQLSRHGHHQRNGAKWHPQVVKQMTCGQDWRLSK